MRKTEDGIFQDYINTHVFPLNEEYMEMFVTGNPNRNRIKNSLSFQSYVFGVRFNEFAEPIKSFFIKLLDKILSYGRPTK